MAKQPIPRLDAAMRQLSGCMNDLADRYREMAERIIRACNRAEPPPPWAGWEPWEFIDAQHVTFTDRETPDDG